MKKSCLAALFFLLVSGGAQAAPPPRGLFVSVIQDPPVFSSREAIHALVQFSKEHNIDTLFVQVYRSNQSWFPSKHADASAYESASGNLGGDPLQILIEEAHASGIKVHAWLNLMSLSANENAPILKKYGPSVLTTNRQSKKTLQEYKIDNQYFLEPGDLRVREELSAIVGELLTRYTALDGIQFDYIRYPDKNPAYGYTNTNLERFKKASGMKTFEEKSRTWQRWKRNQVTDLLKELAEKSRCLRPGIQVSTTGLTSYDRAYFEAMQDWRLWVNSGLIDFVTLMCYSHEDTARFKRYVADAERRLGGLKKANIAVGAYALTGTPAIFDEQWKACEESKPRSCVVLHYGSLLEKAELIKSLE